MAGVVREGEVGDWKTGPANKFKLDARRLAYALALSVALALPVAGLVGIAPDEFLEQMPCFSFLPGSRRLAGYLLSAFALALSFPLAYAGLGAAPSLLGKLERVAIPRFLPLSFDRRSIAMTAGVLAACWAPVFVVLAPCTTTAYDTASQLYQFLTPAPTYYDMVGRVVDAELIDHHPVFDTVLMGGAVAIGRWVGSDALGFLLYGVLQGTACATVLAAAVCYLERLGVAPVLRLAALVVVAIFPVFPVSADTMQKETLFAAASLPWFLCYIEACRTKGAALSSWRFTAGFLVLGCLTVLTKKTGAILVLLSLPFLLVALRGNCKRAACAAIAPVLLCLGLLPLAYPALSIAPGGSQEALGMLYQQVVTVVKSDADALSEGDVAVVNKVIDLDAAVKSYQRHKTDNVKRQQRADVSAKDLAAFVAVWAKCGLAHPAAYAKAHLQCCAAMLVPSMYFELNTGISAKGLYRASRFAEAAGTDFAVDARSWQPGQVVADALNGFYRDFLAVVPPFSLFLTLGFWGSWLPLVVLAACLYFDKHAVVMVAPYLLSALLLLACPANVVRYVLPLVFFSIPALGVALRAARGTERNG